ncbi:hypothetical protein AC1031_006822 [Aphanomyces cochlioides]|nr:hypothetical protein AC1031_006822 [Aphanomyces cochlioides]
MSVAYGFEAIHTEIQPRTLPVRHINNAIRNLDMKQVEAALLSTNMEIGVAVCPTSKSDWKKYLALYNQALLSKTMQWRNGTIYIVSLPGKIHESTISDISKAIREPLIPILDWGEFHTLKIEVGVSRGWTTLNEKADHWATFPGVAYVLCVRVTPHFHFREFKLHTIGEFGGVVGAAAAQDVPVMDITVATVVTLDSRRLLALGQGAPLRLVSLILTSHFRHPHCMA